MKTIEYPMLYNHYALPPSRLLPQVCFSYYASDDGGSDIVIVSGELG
jgi:hypothetical protein